jgi:hypothetical protein
MQALDIGHSNEPNAFVHFGPLAIVSTAAEMRHHAPRSANRMDRVPWSEVCIANASEI